MRTLKRVLQVVVVAITLIVGGLALAIVATQTAWFKNWLRGYIVREAHHYINGQVSVGRLGGNLFYGLELEDVDVVMDGRPVVSVKDIGLRYNTFELVSKGLTIESIRVNQPVLHLKRDGDGWSIGRLIKKERQEANRQGPGRPITIEDIRLSAGSIVFDTPFTSSGVSLPSRVEDIDAQVTFRYKPVRYSVEIAHLSFRAVDRGLVVDKLSAGIAVREDELYFSNLTLRTPGSSFTLDGAVENYLSNPSLKMQVASEGLSLMEISQVVPSLADLSFRPAFRLNVNGPLDRLAVDVDVRSAAGAVSGQLTTNLTAADRAVQGTLSVRHLDLAQLLNKPDIKTDLTGTVKPDLRAASFAELDSWRATVDFDGSRVVAANYSFDQINGKAWVKGRDLRIDARGTGYGANATFRGTLTVPRSGEAFAYNLSGNLQRVNLSRLPAPFRVPGANSNLNGSYHASGAGTINLRGDVLFAESQIAGATVRSGSTAEFSLRNFASQWRQVEYRTSATMADLDLQRIGRAFSISALDDDRYRTSLNTQVQAAGRLGSSRSIEATISGELVDSTLFRGHVQQLTFDAQFGDDAVHVKAGGSVTDWDPKVVNPDIRFEGALAGSLDVDGTITNLSDGFTPEHVDGVAKLSLAPSQVGGVHIERGTFAGRLDRRLLDVQVLDIQGPQVDVQAKGTVSLAADGASNLEVHAHSSDLSELGKLVDQPVTGIATLDAKVTGNRTSSRVEGTLLANDVAYQNADALVLVTEFTADVPDLSVRDAKVSAMTNGTFISVAGQHINELSAKTNYERSLLDVDLTARQPQRSVNAAGSVLLHPDHQEVHLTRLDLVSQNLQWHLVENADAKIRYGGGVTTIEGLRAVSGDQVIDAAGAIGKGDETLTITLRNVDLRSVDAILLRSPQFSGLINGSGTITGIGDALNAKASFEVNQGGFRGFRYESFKGSVDVVGNNLTIDSELQQHASAWLRIKGRIPVAAFRASSEESKETETSDDRIDLQIESAPIDLGVVQGFTTVLTNVTGTAQANIHLKGSAKNPSPSGTIVVTNGAFKVEPTGVSYAHFNGRIELQGNRAHIAQLDVLDNHDQWVSLTGDMPIRPSETGDVSLQITARDFKVVDNKMGNVRVNSDLNLAGELRAPRLSGDLAIATGTVNLDPLLAAISGSGYATTPTEYLPAASKSSAQAASTQGRPFGFAGMRMDVRLRVPDDLVVRSRDLRVGSSPIGFGAINVTLGGDLVATKDPGETVRLVGTVNAVRGTYQFQGRQFTILRDGLIRFNGDPVNQLNPTLDVRTQRMIQGVQANANIRGTLRSPRIQLSSVPPLERADIFSLIVFNQPVNELGEGQQISLGQRAEQLALGSIAGGLSSSLGNLLNVSEFQLQTSPDSNSAAQLTVGQQVSQNLFVKVEYSVGDVSTTNLVLEYELRKWLRLQTNLIQAASAQQALFQAVHDSGFDLIFTFTR